MSTASKDTDILVSGGGIAGLSAAILMARAGFHVTCVDPVPPVTDAAAEGADMRSTAFLQPARDTLADAGIWDHLEHGATPLEVMRLMDVGGGAAQVRDFRASDVSDRPFGWNVPNWLIRRGLVAAAAQTPQLTFLPGTALAHLTARSGEALARLSDGTRLTARMVIGADGRGSPTRQAAGLSVRTTRFGQRAMAFAVTHPLPHDNISTEIHDTGGPFTLVPLPDRDGTPASAVVWMERGPRAQELYALEDAAFETEMTARSQEVLGPLKLASRRSIWPMIAQLATRLDGPRVALVAEAAHVVPPIGAQGLNMSLADLTCLRDLAAKTPESLGAPEMLRAYHKARYADMAARVAGITALNRASMASSGLARAARAKAMTALYDIAPVRKRVMELGLGTRSVA